MTCGFLPPHFAPCTVLGQQECYYTSEDGAAPSSADIVACLKQQQPQLVLIKQQHCQIAGLQESLAEAGYVELVKAGAQGSIFAKVGIQVPDGAVSGQASSTELDGSGSSSAPAGLQADCRRGFGMQFSWWLGGTGQGDSADGDDSGRNNGDQHGSGQPPQDAGNSSSGGDEASGSKDSKTAARDAAHAACNSASCGSLKLRLSQHACASTLGQGNVICRDAVAGDTGMKVLKFKSILDGDSNVLTEHAVLKLRRWPLQPVSAPHAQLTGEHGFKVELALSMCKHKNQVRARSCATTCRFSAVGMPESGWQATRHMTAAVH